MGESNVSAKTKLYGDRKRKPVVPFPNPAGIPAELKAERRWVNWRFTWKAKKEDEAAGKWDKPPLRPNGKFASTTNPATWSTYDECVAAVHAAPGGALGIGFMLGDGWAGIDLDGVYDPVNGVLLPWVKELVGRAGGFVDLSPSSLGLKLIGRGKEWTQGWNRKPHPQGGEVEVYDAARYFTVTGRHVTERAAGGETVADLTATMDALAVLLADPVPEPAPTPAGATADPKTEAGSQAAAEAPSGGKKESVFTVRGPTELTDDEVVWRAENDTRAFGRRWAGGDSDNGGDTSRADLGLCRNLVFWCGGHADAARIDRLFRRSKRLRDKWDEKHKRDGSTYGQMTIAKAMKSQTVFYTGRNPNEADWKNSKTSGASAKAERSAGREGAAEPQPGLVLDDTDVANGLQFVADHGADVRYAADWGRWVVFDGRRWEVDGSGTLVEARAKRTVRRMAAGAADRVAAAAKQLAAAEDEELKVRLQAELAAAKRALTWAKKSQDVRAIGRMLTAARSEPLVNVQRGADRFDRQAYLLNVPNGTVDLRDGELRGHDRDDYLTKLCPTRYVPDAPRAGYLAFLDLVFRGRPAVAAYIRALSGYAATGETCDHSFHVFHGGGSNGKSVLLGLWVPVLGEYAHTAMAELLVNDGRERHPTELVGLRGARLAVCSETAEDGYLDEAKLKRLTSSDPITARGMRQDFYTFPPTHKLILATNYKPRLKGSSEHGTRRRLRLVPFEVRFWKEADRVAEPDREYDPGLKADPGLTDRLLATEAEGVLADVVEHAVAFYAADRTLNPPAEVLLATTEYLKDEDWVGQFFDACVRDEPTGRVAAAKLYFAFKAWCQGQGLAERNIPGPRKFGIVAHERLPSRKASCVVYLVRLLTSVDDTGGWEEESKVGDRFSTRACA